MTDVTLPPNPQPVGATHQKEVERDVRPKKVGASPPRSSTAVSKLPRFAGHTTKRYQLREDGRQTVADLRHILNQKGLPGAASVKVADGALTLEWDE